MALNQIEQDLCRKHKVDPRRYEVERNKIITGGGLGDEHKATCASLEISEGTFIIHLALKLAGGRNLGDPVRLSKNTTLVDNYK